ncbi:MAG: UDP-N-acetylmuramate dehydrogenase [Lachnospiraceae bacterium]|nr:UDP-N-acetylmuramate dehydrogenase [Lachnospiraceae bacterium]
MKFKREEVNVNTVFYNQLKELLPTAEIFYEEPMSKHTTFRIGGAADVFIKISEEEQLKTLIPYLTEKHIPYYVIGKGSNLLVGDKGFRGVVLQLADTFETVKVNLNVITACAGASMAMIAKAAQQNGLTGLEFAAGIPGSVGGGVIMNAGAYGGEMKDVISKVRFLCRDGSVKEYTGEEMCFGYRTSALKNKPEYIVLEIEMLLQPGDKEEILKKMQELAVCRREKQPLEYPSAGSTFKRPEGYFAGKLIGDAGLGGYAVGDACVSEKHNGFVINRGKASAQDVQTLIEIIQCKVYEQFGVELEREVIYLGDFM